MHFRPHRRQRAAAVVAAGVFRDPCDVAPGGCGRRSHAHLFSASNPSRSPSAHAKTSDTGVQTSTKFKPLALSGVHGAGNTIEGAARSLREMWMLPAGPIADMVELLEANRGIVLPCDFGTDLIDAMSQRIEGLLILFLVNINSPSDRLRHTLAHELGHMILHTITVKSDEEMEDEADAFAGAFLLPADEIRPQLRRFDLRQLADLKLYWKVSSRPVAPIRP